MSAPPPSAASSGGAPAPPPGREPFGRPVQNMLVLADFRKPGVAELLDELEAWLRPRLESLELRRDLREYCKAVSTQPTPTAPAHDAIVVLGGDGSILSAVRAFGAAPIPILGINFGHIGFLASVRARDWQAALREVIEGRSVIEPRMRLRGELHGKDGRQVEAVALNEMLVQRGAVQGMLTISLWEGESWISDYRCDGLIVASPSGSTAHSLAAGGPILAPSMRGLVVTPISPQSLSHRPLVVHPASQLSLRVERASGLTTLAVDGHGFYPMEVGDLVRVGHHDVPYPLLARPDSDPYVRIRERLGWRGSFDPEPELDPHAALPGPDDAGRGEVL